MKLQLSIDYPVRIKRREMAYITQNKKKTTKMQMVKDTINSNEQQLNNNSNVKINSLTISLSIYIALYCA